VPRFKQLSVTRVDLSSLEPKVKRKFSARQIAQMQRDDEIRMALNQAATIPESQAVVIGLKDGQKLPTLRAAIYRVLRAEPHDLNWGVRGQQIVISKGSIPGRRANRKK
jgi:hypothetical protein